MNLEINSVNFRNFFSFGNRMQEFVPPKGINLILGNVPSSERSNGAGKSSLLETFSFSLFGKVQRSGVNLEHIVNWKNGKNCEVCINFNIGKNTYEILRGLKPSVLKVFKNGKIVENFSDKRDYQRWIEEEILHIDYNTFINLIYLKMNSPISILSMKKWEKRNLVDKLFNLRIYKRIQLICNDKIKQVNQTLFELETKQNANNTIIKHHQNEVEKLNNELKSLTSSENEISKILTKLNIEKQYLKENITKKTNLPENIDDKIEIQKEKIKKYKNILEKLRNKKQQIKNEIISLKALKEDTLYRLKQMEGKGKCPLCWSSINVDKIKKAMNEDNRSRDEKIKCLNNRMNALHIKKYEENIKKCKNEIKVLTKTKEELYEIEKTLIKIKSNIKEFINKLAYLKEKIKNEEQAKQNLLNKIYIQKNEINHILDENLNISKRCKKLTNILDYFTLIKQLCSDEAVKQYAISSAIPYINKQINYYLSESQQHFYVVMDNWLKAKIKGPGITNGVYGNLSDGERKSIDLACQQAFLDVARIQSTTFPDILLYDELLDSSLDDLGLEKLLEIVRLKQTEDNTKVFIVSHRKEIKSSDFDNIFLIEKDNGFSKIVKL